MKKIEQLRSRLSTLTGAQEAPPSSPAEDLKACRALQERLRELKLEVLGQVAALRSEAHDRAQGALGRQPSAPAHAERRRSEAAKLLRDVGYQVKGLIDDGGAAKLEKWSAIHREIDAHLERLAQLESQLARAAGPTAGPLRTPERPARADGDDELYAAVGAAVQQGQKPGAFCAHCGRGAEPDDRFCRQCGHRRL